jgi:RimJ/RimL family protein N-acetyltransferase
MPREPSTFLRSKAPLEVILGEDFPVRLRPIVRSDEERVHRAFELLSPDSRMNRFWEKSREISAARAKNLTDTDESDHVAWIALCPDDEDFPGYAGASFWRDREDSSRAELAFTVADEWQRSGLATLLFSVLWFDGWQLGIRTFHGSCRIQNLAMAEWWEGVGGNVERGSREFRLSLDLVLPEHFLEQVSYGMPCSYRQIEVAFWMKKWRELLD